MPYRIFPSKKELCASVGAFALFAAFSAGVVVAADAPSQPQPAPEQSAAADAVPAPEKTPEKKKPVYAPESMEVAAPMRVPTPLFADVENLQGKKFDAEAKLRLPVPAPDKLAYAGAPRAADGFFAAAGVEVSAEAPLAEDTLAVFRVFATPGEFTRGKIRVSSPQRLELWSNGKRLADKLSVEESAEKSGAATADFNFEIERREFIVKVLAEKGSKLPPMLKFEIEAQTEGVPAIAFSDGKEKRPITIADVNEARRIATLGLSPDGKHLLVVYSTLRPDGTAERRQEVRDARSGEIVFAEDGSRNYVWTPKGSCLFFRRKNPTLGCDLVGFDLETRRERVFAEGLPDENHGYSWLPDMSGFIVSKTEKWREESPNWKRVLNTYDRQKNWRDRVSLLHYDLKSGVFTPLTAGARSTGLQGISPDSKKILFAVHTPDYSQPEYKLSDLYLLDLETLECKEIFKGEKYSPALAAWSPDSTKALLIAGPDAFGGLGSTLPEGQQANSYDEQAYVCDLAAGTIEAISKDFKPSMKSAVWAGDGNIYFTTTDGDRETVFRYEPEAKRYTPIRVPAEVVAAFNVQRDPSVFRPVAYAVGAGPVSFQRVYKVDLEKNEAVPAFAEDFHPEDEIAMPEVRTWTFVASDGTTVDGHCYLPPNFDPEKKYPMIVYYYGGTTPTTRVLGSHYPFPLYAAQGYVVYVVQPSGTIGYGQEFSARHLNAWGKRTADDIIEGVKAFCREHPFVDEKKIGCIGASYGGFMTMYLQTRTDIFAAAVAHAGISDITSYWGEGMWGYSYNAVAAAGSFPWKDREIFVEQSPLFAADKIKTPILLCHGLSDTNVPVGESVQMFTALKLLGKPVELLTFTAEDHGIADYARRKQWLKSHLAWFARWLKDEPEWWSTLYPDKNW